MAGSKNKAWSEEEKEYLKQITPGHHYKEIQSLVNNKFDLDLTLEQIKNAVSRYKLNTGFTGQFKKGDIPANKGRKGMGGWEPTQFKKGHAPVNHRPVGSERINVYGYTEVKVSDPNKWRLKHQLIWEEHNGAIPKSHVVIFGDRNKNNFEPNNLILVSKQQLLILNKKKLIQIDADLTRSGIIIADLYQKISERKAKAK